MPPGLPLKLGTLDAQGQFTAGKRGGIGEVRAEAGKLAGTARVRVVPELPISEDFESYKDGDTIGWWVGVSKPKYTIETLDGSKVLKKLHDDKGPIFNRSLAFITPPIAAGYTVEADVMGVKEGRRRGDVGVVNSPLRAGAVRRRQEAAGHVLGPRAAVREEDRFRLGPRHVVPHEAQGGGRRRPGQDLRQGLAPQRGRADGLDHRGRRSAAQPRRLGGSTPTHDGPGYFATRPNPRNGRIEAPIRSRTAKALPGSMPTAPWRHCIWTISRSTGRR